MKSTLFGDYNIIFCPAVQAAEHAERAEMCKMCVNEKRRMRSALFGLGVSILDFHLADDAYLAPMGLVHFQRFWAGLWKMDRDFASFAVVQEGRNSRFPGRNVEILQKSFLFHIHPI